MGDGPGSEADALGYFSFQSQSACRRRIQALHFLTTVNAPSTSNPDATPIGHPSPPCHPSSVIHHPSSAICTPALISSPLSECGKCAMLKQNHGLQAWDFERATASGIPAGHLVIYTHHVRSRLLKSNLIFARCSSRKALLLYPLLPPDLVIVSLAAIRAGQLQGLQFLGRRVKLSFVHSVEIGNSTDAGLAAGRRVAVRLSRACQRAGQFVGSASRVQRVCPASIIRRSTGKQNL